GSMQELGFRLHVAGPGLSATHPLPRKTEITIGRSETADLPIPDSSVSRRHALLKIGPKWSVEDMGSSNGTAVNGIDLEPGTPHQVGAGDVIRVGDVAILIKGPRPAG